MTILGITYGTTNAYAVEENGTSVALDMSGCTSLVKLDCTYNNILTLNVNGCASLEC